MLIVYGIPNCDSCKKARKWLDANAGEYIFHDLRKDGVDKGLVLRLAGVAGWQRLLNTRSTTWRNLARSEREDISEKRALNLMLEHPTLVKRPVLESEGRVLVGFSPETFSEFFKN